MRRHCHWHWILHLHSPCLILAILTMSRGPSACILYVCLGALVKLVAPLVFGLFSFTLMSASTAIQCSPIAMRVLVGVCVHLRLPRCHSLCLHLCLKFFCFCFHLLLLLCIIILNVFRWRVIVRCVLHSLGCLFPLCSLFVFEPVLARSHKIRM